jgi:hypothetical protein
VLFNCPIAECRHADQFFTLCWVLGAVLLASSGLSLAQKASPPAATTSEPAASTSDASGETSSSPLAAAARSTKAQKAAKAEKVFTDEDMEATAGPLPRLKMDGGRMRMR